MLHGDIKNTLAVFPSSLGWMAVQWNGPLLARCTFGHRTPQQAARAIHACFGEDSELYPAHDDLVQRLQAFADGSPDSFEDVELDLAGYSAFQRRVTGQCRLIPFGSTRTYGQLAAQAGSPGAARAVGSVMAANRFSLIVPCHRVVPANGLLGGFSAPEGPVMKQRLLGREAEPAAACMYTR